MGLEFELKASALQSRHSGLRHTSGPFCSGYFGDGDCGGWGRLVNYFARLPISASRVVRITNISHQFPTLCLRLGEPMGSSMECSSILQPCAEIDVFDMSHITERSVQPSQFLHPARRI
jgi:hypothetical protein